MFIQKVVISKRIIQGSHLELFKLLFLSILRQFISDWSKKSHFLVNILVLQVKIFQFFGKKVVKIWLQGLNVLCKVEICQYFGF